jgi:hypothetical protein
LKRRGAVSSHPGAGAAAEAALVDGASAIQAVIAGFFVAAASSPSVLFSPLGLLSGGVGHGVRAFDGRAREPGLEARRPRGFRPDEALPEAARLAAPGSVAALAVSNLYHGGSGLSSLAREGVATARRLGLTERAETIEQVARLGVPSLRQPRIQTALLERAGPAARGNLSAADLDCRFTVDYPAEASAEDRFRFPSQGLRPSLGVRHAIVAADASGLFAALQFFDDPDVPLIPALGVGLPRLATPVVRGVPRPKPGALIDSPLDLELQGSAGALDLLVAGSDQGRISLRQDRRSKEVSLG